MGPRKDKYFTIPSLQVMKKGLKRQLNYIEPIDASFAEKIFLFEKLVKRPPPMAAMVAGPMMDLKKEEKTKMYPEEWWWAERQVSEVLAEHPGELVKTGEKKRMWRRRAVSQRHLGPSQALLTY